MTKSEVEKIPVDSVEYLLQLAEPQYRETAKAAINRLLIEARISTLKRFSHIPPPHDEEWSPEFQKGVEHGIRISQGKLRFEVQRLKKQLGEPR